MNGEQRADYERQVAVVVDAVSRTMYDLAQDHISVLGVNVGLVANGVMRLSLSDVAGIAVRALAHSDESSL